MKREFLDRLLTRTDKLDKQQVVDVLLDVIEERNLLRLLFDTMVEGMIVLKKDKTVSYVNETASRILGIPEEGRQQRLDGILSSPELLELCRVGVDSSATIRDREVTANLDGKKRTLRVNVLPLSAQKESLLGALVLFVDVTEQKLQEVRLRKAEKLAALTTLSSGITHEIRNPLNALSIHLQLLKRQLRKQIGGESEEIEKTIELLRREVKRLNEVIELFLKATRPTQPEFRRVVLTDLITDTLQLLRPDLERRRIDVQLVESRGRPVVLADERLLRQVFLNLIKNAAEAIDEAVGELGEDVERKILLDVGADETATTVHIHDTGAGMLQEDLEHVFEPYFTTKESGTGLGLMVCEGIIRQHGGELDVRSQVGVGTEFTVTLPPPQEPVRLIPDDTTEATEV